MSFLHRSASRVARAAWPVLAAALLLVPATGGAATLSSAGLKRFQAYQLAREPMEERAEKREHREMARERKRELRRLARAMARDGRTSLRVTGESARPATPDEDAVRGGAAAPRAARPAATDAVAFLPRPNKRCNDPLGDGALDGQCETAIARWNNFLVAAWNDGTGFTDGSNETQGWATSVDGGVTWVDQGAFPKPAGYANWVWTSDPVLAVNPTTGAFYYTGLGDATQSLSAIGVLKGRFNGTSFAWGTTSVVRTVSSNSDFLDKEWLAVDPASGRVLVTYTEFPSNIARIECQAADSALSGWTVAQQLSLSIESGFVQGSRPAFGPGGVAYVVYYLIGSVDADDYRVCKSTNGGVSFSTPVTAASMYANFGTGAPGFNREQGIQFPSIAVDRSGGAHDGRLYLSWSESLNWFDDAPQVGALGRKAEVEPNDTFAAATPLAVGQTGSGDIAALADLNDWWSLHLDAGQTVIVAADTIGASTVINMRLFAGDGATRLAYTTASDGEIAQGFNPSWIYTAPTSGTYYLRVQSSGGSGPYRVATGAAVHGSERGRDQRDAFMCHSDDDGATWSTPVRVSNSPVGYDDWLPEIAVAGDGQVYAAWYDFRDAAATTDGGESSVYLARSSDGGATWAEVGPTSDARTAWTAVQSNIIPNEGDYISLFADASGLTAAWSDGRTGNPDVYMSYWTQTEISTLPALLSVTALPHQVDLRWKVGAGAGFAARVYRRVPSAATWDSLRTIFSSSDGTLAITDTSVVSNQSYQYRLGVMQGATEYFYGQASVTTPGASTALELAGAWPNPATRASVIAFTLTGTGNATLDVLDLNGRRVSSRSVGALGAGLHTLPLENGERLRPGVYFLRLSQAGTTRNRRIVVL